MGFAHRPRYPRPGAAAEVRKDDQHKDPAVGDFQGAYAAGEVKIDARYSTPTQHHNPMELFTTSCVWNGGKLTIYESSQFVRGLRSARTSGSS